MGMVILIFRNNFFDPDVASAALSHIQPVPTLLMVSLNPYPHVPCTPLNLVTERLPEICAQVAPRNARARKDGGRSSVCDNSQGTVLVFRKKCNAKPNKLDKILYNTFPITSIALFNFSSEIA